jgi:transcriptional regulator with XRE-family HTH domain
MTRKKIEPAPVPIGRQIAATRAAAGLTQAGLAERAGTSQNRISSIERGTTEPTVPMLCRLADALGCSMLLDGDGPRLVDPAEIDGR